MVVNNLIRIFVALITKTNRYEQTSINYLFVGYYGGIGWLWRWRR